MTRDHITHQVDQQSTTLTLVNCCSTQQCKTLKGGTKARPETVWEPPHKEPIPPTPAMHMGIFNHTNWNRFDTIYDRKVDDGILIRKNAN